MTKTNGNPDNVDPEVTWSQCVGGVVVVVAFKAIAFRVAGVTLVATVAAADSSVVAMMRHRTEAFVGCVHPHRRMPRPPAAFNHTLYRYHLCRG